MTIPLKKMILPPQSPLTTNCSLGRDGVLWFSPSSMMGCWRLQSCAGLMHVVTGVACSWLHWTVHGSKIRREHFTVLCHIFQFLHFSLIPLLRLPQNIVLSQTSLPFIIWIYSLCRYNSCSFKDFCCISQRIFLYLSTWTSLNINIVLTFFFIPSPHAYMTYWAVTISNVYQPVSSPLSH